MVVTLFPDSAAVIGSNGYATVGEVCSNEHALDAVSSNEHALDVHSTW